MGELFLKDGITNKPANILFLQASFYNVLDQLITTKVFLIMCGYVVIIWLIIDNQGINGSD